MSQRALGLTLLVVGLVIVIGIILAMKFIPSFGSPNIGGGMVGLVGGAIANVGLVLTTTSNDRR